MGDHDEAAGVTGEVFLEPEQGLEIEMVRRFVEEQERGLGHEEAGEMSAHDPAAGKRFGELERVAFFEAETGEDFFRARLERVVDVVVVLVGFEFFAAGGDVENGLVAGRSAFLREVAEVGAAFPFDGAGVGFFFTEDEAEKGGFARAVGPDQAEAIGARDEERDFREEFAGAVGLGNVGDGEHENPQINAILRHAVNGAVLASQKCHLIGDTRF